MVHAMEHAIEHATEHHAIEHSLEHSLEHAIEHAIAQSIEHSTKHAIEQSIEHAPGWGSLVGRVADEVPGGTEIHYPTPELPAWLCPAGRVSCQFMSAALPDLSLG